jgi:menaquinol-cytochrome c reductase iron-sulfur subunit
MPDISRRNAFVLAIYAVWGAIFATLGLPALTTLLMPPKLRRQEEWIEVGDIGTLTPDTPREMVYRRNRVDGWKVVNEKSTAWVVKSSHTNKVVAFGPECTHLGCPYHWEEGRKDFVCPCHDSVFSLEGKVLAGPAPRPLDRFQTKIEGNKLFIGQRAQSTEEQA